MIKLCKTYFGLFMLPLIVFLGCQELDDFSSSPVEETQVQLNQDHPVLQRLLEEGFALSDIKEYEDYFVVENDIVVYKFEPHEHGVPNTEQARTDRIVAPAYRNINIYLNAGSFSSINLSTPLNLAINAINATNTQVTMTRVTSASQANIIVTRNDGIGTNVCGQAGFPFSNGRPFNRVNISERTLTTHGITSQSQLTLLVAHEIGHCIGFRHTNWRSLGESGGIQIAGTPATDNTSMMNGATCGVSWTGLSTNDRTAMRVLYGDISPGGDRLLVNQRLLQNQFIRSTDGRFTLIMQGDGNLVLYKFNTPLWHTNTWGNPQINRCVMQSDGNLVLYDTSNQPHWHSNTWRYPGSWTIMQNDGNLVIYEGGLARWASNTCCH